MQDQVSSSIPTETAEHSRQIEQKAALLKALSHPVRLLIVNNLIRHQCNVGNLEKMAGLSQSGVSQHLRILRLSGIIEPERIGKEICYKIVEPLVEKLIRLLEL